MVVGNGLIANAFKNFKEDDSIVIFASGVSDSLQTSPREFIREKDLLIKYFSQKRKLVYFSTCSLSDESLSHTPYIHHKNEIENLIQERQESYIIFRLPIIVGQSLNPHTLTNFFYNKIVDNQIFQTHASSCRYLLDIDDAGKIIEMILNKNYFDRETINVTLNNRIRVTELVEIFEKVLHLQANHELVDKGACYNVDNSKIIELLDEMNIDSGNDYNFQLIQKYYGEKRHELFFNLNNPAASTEKSLSK